MNIRHLALSMLATAAMGSAHAASLPPVSTNLGTDPTAAPVVGFAVFNSGNATYNFNLSNVGTLTGALFGIGNISIDSILLGATPVALTSGGTFSVSGLAAGSHALTFNYSSTSIGGFVGSVTATPVPEAGSLLMALGGAGVVAFAARRRKQA
jgi:PEP-CTERM motif